MFKDRSAILFKIYKIIGSILAGACILASTLIFPHIVDEEGYFISSPLTTLWRILTAACLIFAFSAFFAMKGKASLAFKRPRLGYWSPITALGIIVSLAFVAMDNGIGAPSWLLMLCGVLAAAYFILADFGIFKSPEPEISLGLVTIIFCLLIVAEIYTDTTEKLNSPVKLIPTFAAAAIMINTLSELRHRFSTNYDGFTFFANLSSVILCISAYLIGYFGQNADPLTFISTLSPFSYFFLAYGIYAARRFASLSFVSTADESDGCEYDLDSDLEEYAEEIYVPFDQASEEGSDTESECKDE